MVLSIGKGYSTGYLTDQVATGREGYYTSATDAGHEPAGQWHGTLAAKLGLAGEVDPAVLEAVYSRLLDPRDPATADRSRWDEAASLPMARPGFQSVEGLYETYLRRESSTPSPERREELWVEAQKNSRQAVAFLDLTFSAPKSVSVVAVAFERAAVEAERRGEVEEAEVWRLHHQVVEEAVMVGARSTITYLEEVAGFSRGGRRDALQWVDAHGWVVAQFLQHDSREKDPQLHVHQAVLNGVETATGKWQTLDSMAIRLHRPAAEAIGERAMEEHLARTLGLRFETRPDGVAREVVGVSESVMEMFSARSRAIGPKAQAMEEEFRQAMGREPSTLERHRMRQQATLLTRKGKSYDGETPAARLERWAAQIQREVGETLAGVAEQVVALRQDAGPVAEWSPRDVMERALAEVSSREATWSRARLMGSISKALPGNLGLGPDQMRELLDSLTDAALERAVKLTPDEDLSIRPAEFLLEDGSDAFQRPGSAVYATPDQLAAEKVLRAQAVERGAEKVSHDEVSRLIAQYAERGVELGVDQAAAVRGVLTSGAQVEVLAAPAGAGKTVVVGALAEMWKAHGRQVLGLAPSQIAADVLADEGVEAVNIARWLHSSTPVEAGAIVVVDEAGMASTSQISQVRERCREAGAKLLLVGDPKQLGPVGPGGAMADLVEHAESYELAEVRRFLEQWERAASLELRDGNTSCLEQYEKHGSIRSSGTEEEAEAAALRAWLADTVSARESLLLVGSNEAAARVSARARAELVARGVVQEDGVHLGRDGNTAGVGDIVQARRNAWDLPGTPINRATYRVTGVLEDGGLEVVPTGGAVETRVEMPASYVLEHVTLAYASTVHAAQGRTVDTAHAVIGSSTNTSSAYVGLTRGRQSNTAWVVTTPTGEDSPPGQVEKVEVRTGRAVLEDVVERDQAIRSAMAERDLQELEARSEFTVAGQLIEGISHATAGTTSALLDRLEADGTITGGQRVALATDDAMGAVERLLRDAELAGKDRGEVLADALGGRSLATARDPGRVLYHRLHHSLQVDGTVSSFRDLIPATAAESHRPWLEERATTADARRAELGEQAAAEQPEWAISTLGPVPADEKERAAWVEKAGWAAAYREIAQHEDSADPLGPAPPSGLAEKHAIWRTAHAALGMVDRGPDEGAMSEGQLRVRVAAYEREKVWAPAPVRELLTATSIAADEKRVDGTLSDAGAELVAEAEALTERASTLAEADEVRAKWAAEVAKTREAADRARAELEARGIDLDDPAERVTAEEWAAAHAEHMAREDAHREIDTLADDQPADELPVESHLETAVPDIRETAEMHPAEDVDRERGQVASVDDVADAVARAQEALAEIRNRASMAEPADEDTYVHEAEQTETDDHVMEAAL